MRTADGYIISKCLNGDSAAFGLLVDKYKGSVYALAYSKLRNFHDAEDVTQEVFIKAYRKLRTLKQYDSFHAWLYAATSNLCKDWLKALSRRPDNQFIEDKDPETLEAPSIDSYRESLFRESLYESLHEALDSMPETHSQVLTLRYLGGMSCKEIASFLGVSPTAIWQRLSRARAQLKEGMIAMINTDFERQKLQASFTLRIVDAVKRIRIQPMPRTTGLPWGLSLATGIIFTILSFSPQPNMFSRAAAGSPLPSETKVLKVGEIPVDILTFSEVPIIANRQGDGDSGKPETSDTRNATLAVANDEENMRTQESKEVVVDPETGLRYTKVRTLTGKRDVITAIPWPFWLSLSPNGKFLLWQGQVVPLDDGESFGLVEDIPVMNSTWSPDGEKVVFGSGKAIWMIPVSPETGQPVGPAKKLLDGDYRYQTRCWSADSERIVIESRDKETSGNIFTLSVTDGALTQITDDPIVEWNPVWSPDGKTIAYNRGDQLRVIPAEGGSSRILTDEGHPLPVFWSPDSKWIVYLRENKIGQGLRFLRLSDGHEFVMNLPDGVGHRFISWSPDGKKMLFYRSSYYWKSALKAISTSGGESFELGRQTILWPYEQFWSPDSRMIVTSGGDKDGKVCLWVIPITGEEPFILKLDVSVDGKLRPLYPSPDCSKLAFVVQRSDEKEDLYVVPVSLKDGRTTGPAVMVFSGWKRKQRYYRAFSWSPDGAKIAIAHEFDIWMASADGGEPVQITFGNHPESMAEPVWSPDGKMIRYRAYYSENKILFRVIPASGTEDTVILDIPVTPSEWYEWSPDSRDLLSSSNGVISAISIADGTSRQFLDLKELSVDSAWSFSLSPDGQRLTFLSYGPGDKYQIYSVPAAGGKFTELAADDSGEKYLLFPSPDGKWISYQSDGYIKTRPEGEIWEVDLQELLNSSSP